jgi:hypothetical protein
MLAPIRIEYVDELQGTPARVNIKTGLLQVSMKHFKGYHPDVRRFIILHEMGHYYQQTKDEMKADRWAIKRYMREGRSAKRAVFAMTKVLPYTTVEQSERTKILFNLIRHFDAHLNGNTNALKIPIQ